MISRIAESCFWLNRYVERADNTARLLGVNRSFVLDVPLAPQEQWWPIVVVAGEQHRMRQLVGDNGAVDGETVQDYLTWNADNPVSIYSSIRQARENARTIREVISLETWEAINTLWHWLKRGPGRRQYRDDPDAFYRRVREFAATFQGTCHNTMLHEAPFDFMRLGMLLERAGWTARILDVKHHMLGQHDSGDRTPLEAAHSMALLRSCSATEPFLKRVRQPPTPDRVVRFLLFTETFPRSVIHCVDRVENFLRRIRPGSGPRGAASALHTAKLLEDLERLASEPNVEGTLHEHVTRVVEALATIVESVCIDYFHPGPVADPLQLGVQQ